MATRTTGQKRAKRRERPEEVVLGQYFAGEPVPCSVGCGGRMEVVRVSTADGGGGEVWFECASCAQRENFRVEPATAGERREVKTAVASGRGATCPRHSVRPSLQRRGRQLACPRCGVVYRE